jgi:hypothetical protein
MSGRQYCSSQTDQASNFTEHQLISEAISSAYVSDELLSATKFRRVMVLNITHLKNV